MHLASPVAQAGTGMYVSTLHERLQHSRARIGSGRRSSHASAESGVLFLLGEVAAATTEQRPACFMAGALAPIADAGMTFIAATVCILIK